MVALLLSANCKKVTKTVFEADRCRGSSCDSGRGTCSICGGSEFEDSKQKLTSEGYSVLSSAPKSEMRSAGFCTCIGQEYVMQKSVFFLQGE